MLINRLQPVEQRLQSQQEHHHEVHLGQALNEAGQTLHPLKHHRRQHVHHEGGNDIGQAGEHLMLNEDLVPVSAGLARQEPDGAQHHPLGHEVGQPTQEHEQQGADHVDQQAGPARVDAEVLELPLQPIEQAAQALNRLVAGIGILASNGLFHCVCLVHCNGRLLLGH